MGMGGDFGNFREVAEGCSRYCCRRGFVAGDGKSGS